MPQNVSLPRGNDQSMDRFNDALRAEPWYRQLLQSMGVNPDGPVRLSGAQRSQVERAVRQRYPNLAGKFQIDPAGNVNTDHGLSTAWSNPYFRYPLLAAGAVGTAGALGAFGGAAGAGGAAGGTGGTLASSSLPVSALMGGPPAIASQGVSAMVPGLLASSSIPTAALMGGPPSIASQGASRGIPLGGVTPNARGGTGGDGTGIGDRAGDFFSDPSNLLKLAPIVAMLAAGRPGGDSGQQTADRAFLDKAYADAQRNNAMKEARFRRVDPLHEAVTQLAFNRLPTNATNGIALNRVPLPQ